MSIQVRNFTPFPVRDAVTSSLAVTGPPPSDCVDDMELTLGRRRSRKISSNSLGTIRNLRTSSEFNRSDQTSPTLATDTPLGRPRASSRSIRKSIPTTYPHRPTRERAASSASLQSLAKLGLNKPRVSLSTEDTSPPTSPVLAILDEAELQTELEQVVASRLVETFLTLEPWTQEENKTVDHVPLASPSSPVSLNRFDDISSRIRSGSGPSRVTSPRSAAFKPTTPSKSHLNLDKSSRPASPSNLKGSTSRQGPSSILTQSPKTKRAEYAHSTSHALPTPAPSPPPGDILSPTPFYISSFHRPSTNPSFTSLDPKHDFAAWTDLGSHRFKAFLWGTGGSNWGKTAGRDKAKERNPLQLVLDGSEEVSTESEWEVLASWDVDMDELVPLPTEYLSQISILASNTLVVRLSPNGDLYYLPGGQSNAPGTQAPISRPPSPNAGYSDTEVSYTATGTIRRGRRRSSVPLRVDLVNKTLRETRMKKSAGFGDLLKLVTLQSVISDTKVQLDEIIESCDRLLEDNPIGYLQREISQMQETIRSRTEARHAMRTKMAEGKGLLEEKRRQLAHRKGALDDAKNLLINQQEALQDLEEASSDQRQKHATLLASILPARTSALQTVATIYPIEPIEPRDLLFGILDLPLPIPIGVNDPAPPQTIPGNGTYNDEVMASALGFVAQVVNLVASYLGDAPVYPIVCQGSRSMIKDPISAMMGPRMFPLYVRGVDTYRFEYGVFLLNKNIELLMAERNLQALDLRHTLPNLKNLLLTLTSGATIPLKSRSRRKTSIVPPSVIIPVSQNPPTPRSPSPSPAPSEQSSEGTSSHIEATLPTTPTASKIVLEPANSESAEDNAASTATDSLSTIKKSFYSPLASFLRARYPTVRVTANSNPTPANVKVETVASASKAAPAPAPEREDADETATLRGSIRGKSRHSEDGDEDGTLVTPA